RDPPLRGLARRGDLEAQAPATRRPPRERRPPHRARAAGAGAGEDLPARGAGSRADARPVRAEPADAGREGAREGAARDPRATAVARDEAHARGREEAVDVLGGLDA